MAEVAKQKECTCFNVTKVRKLSKCIEKLDLSGVSNVFKAVGHEKRLMVLFLISRGDLCVCDLAHALNAPVPTVSQHLRILKNSGLIYDEQHHKFLIYKMTELGEKIIGDFIDDQEKL